MSDAIRIDPGLEAGYNLRIRHPEREAVYERMAERSRRLRCSVPCRLDLRYGETPLETLDFFGAGPGAPLFVFIHGGYWRALDKSIFSFVAEPFLAAGCAVALTNYGLAPAFTLDRIVAQSLRSIAWLAGHANELAFDPGRIVVGGHSAGGHLAALAAIEDGAAHGPGHRTVAAIAPISGLFDLAPLLRTSVNDAVRMTPEIALQYGPQHRAKPGGIPAVVAVGGGETGAFRDQSRRFAAAWQAAGNDVTWIEPATCNHFTILGELGDGDSALFRAIRDLALDRRG